MDPQRASHADASVLCLKLFQLGDGVPPWERELAHGAKTSILTVMAEAGLLNCCNTMIRNGCKISAGFVLSASTAVAWREHVPGPSPCNQPRVYDG